MVKDKHQTLKAALDHVKLQERILADVTMVDQRQACTLLGLSEAIVAAAMCRKEENGEVIRFMIEGRPAYPSFQFDVDGRRIVPAIARLIAAKPPGWSDFRLLHWLTRPHLDFNGAPAAELAYNAEAVLEAFDREIESPAHG